MSISKNLKKLLASIAPTIGAAIGGPFAGVAMKFLADKFTDGDTGSVEEFLLAADPSSLKELKLAELEFQREMKSLDVDLEEVAYKDRASARTLAATVGIYPQIVGTAIYSIGYFGVLYAFMTGEITVGQEYQSMFNGLLGVLSAAQVQIVNFWFGSSVGSKSKTTALVNNQNG